MVIVLVAVGMSVALEDVLVFEAFLLASWQMMLARVALSPALYTQSNLTMDTFFMRLKKFGKLLFYSPYLGLSPSTNTKSQVTGPTAVVLNLWVKTPWQAAVSKTFALQFITTVK